jgi:hypothetical protein
MADARTCEVQATLALSESTKQSHSSHSSTSLSGLFRMSSKERTWKVSTPVMIAPYQSCYKLGRPVMSGPMWNTVFLKRLTALNYDGYFQSTVTE